MEKGDCYLMINDGSYTVFYITETLRNWCCATDIDFGDERWGLSFNEWEEDYPNEIMESHIPVPSELYFQLIQMMESLLTSLQSLLAMKN